MKTCAKLETIRGWGLTKMEKGFRSGVGSVRLVVSVVLGLWAGGAMVEGGIASVGPIDSMSATGDAGMITAINGVPVSELVLGVTTFPDPPMHEQYPAENADNFDLSLLGSADNQPYFDVWFGQPVVVVFFIENGGNDTGYMVGLDAARQAIGDSVVFTPSSYGPTSYRTGNNQVAAGLVVHLKAPVHGVRVTRPTTTVMGFDPVSISAWVQPGPQSTLQWQRDPSGTGWEIVWEDADLVLQYERGVGTGWTDVPGATSPYPVAAHGEQQFFRLRAPSDPGE